MLVLGRHIDQCVRIVVPPCTEPTTIEVMLVDLREHTARLGFTAPRVVEIHRSEVFARIDAERAALAVRVAESAELVTTH